MFPFKAFYLCLTKHFNKTKAKVKTRKIKRPKKKIPCKTDNLIYKEALKYI